MMGVLITGADGYLGSRLVAKLLREGSSPVVGWVRSADASEFAQKSERLKEFVRTAGAPLERLQIAYGDLRSEQPFASVPANELTHVVHTAAVTRFNVEEDLAYEVNLQGSRKLFEFARACPHLQHLQYVSTLYASGKKTGFIPESPIDMAPEFANFYEQSKWQSEALLLREFGDLPWSICRVATVIADDDTGHVSQYNAVHNTLKLLYYGLISIIPGDEQTPLYFVTGSFATDAIYSVVNAAPEAVTHKIFHIAHTQEESLKVGELLDIVYRVFGEDPDFARRGVLRPLLADETTFDVLASEMDSFQTGIVGQAMSSIRPFARQLFISKDVQNDQLRAAFPQYCAPSPQTLTEVTTAYLAQSKWGRK